MATYYTVVLGLLVLHVLQSCLGLLVLYTLNCGFLLPVGTAHVICLYHVCDMSKV